MTEALEHDVLQRAFTNGPDAIMARAESFVADTHAEANAGVHAASQALRCARDDSLRQYCKFARASAKAFEAHREMAKHVGAYLHALADLCHVAVQSGSNVAVRDAALSEARCGKDLATALKPPHMLWHDVVFDAAATIPTDNLFDVVELDATGAACDADGSCMFFPRGEHSFTLRMAPVNANMAFSAAQNTRSSQWGHLPTRFPLQPSDVSIHFTGDPSATWKCTGQGDAVVVSYNAARSQPEVSISVDVLGICILSQTLVSAFIHVLSRLFGFRTYMFINVQARGRCEATGTLADVICLHADAHVDLNNTFAWSRIVEGSHSG